MAGGGRFLENIKQKLTYLTANTPSPTTIKTGLAPGGGNLRLSHTPCGPRLPDVLAFITLESADDVARVERAASNRMARVRGWDGWRVKSAEMKEDIDGIVRFIAQAEPVGPGYREEASFEFLLMQNGAGCSARFVSFIKAAGIEPGRFGPENINGRYFATKNRGRTVADFAPLTWALVS